MSSAAKCPLVSVVMANYNGAPYLAAAIRSALTQSLAAIELLLVDDGSTDESLAIAQAIAAEDPRLILLPPAPNGGPGAARNRGLAVARGDWVAVMDSDDLMHPERLERLLAAAMRNGADIVADDMLSFFEDGSAPQPMLRGRFALPATVDLTLYIRANVLFGRLPGLGYLKPLFRADMLRRTGLRYDPSLRICEDYDLVARLLAQGARFHILPDLTYFYRRHRTSTSHRLRRSDLEAMLVSDSAIRAAIGPQPVSTEAAFRARRASIERALSYDGIITALKARDPAAAFREAIRSPAGAALLRLPVRDRWRRLFARPKKSAQEVTQSQGRPRGLRVYVISRHRVAGSTGGSATYLLALCRAMAEAGHELHLVWPLPAMFGCTPALRLRPEMTMFRSIAMHGAWRIGSWLVAKDPRVAFAACLGSADKLLRKVGLGLGSLIRKAPQAVALPWREEDFLYVADHIRGEADVILVDHASLTPAYPYALSPGAARVVVMQDLLSDPAAISARIGPQDAAARIEQASELQLLGAADAVVATQAEAVTFMRDALPGRRVIVAPIAVEPMAAPQPGQDLILLFVGSDTTPDVDGLRWFLREVLPLIRQAVPQVVLRVVGRVGHAIGPVPEALVGAVEVLGLVPDLAPHYRDAAVVVLPLLAGSSSNIKLVEALSHGKAVVATGVTLQGVQAECAPVLRPIDEAGEFATEVTTLLRDSALRAKRAAASLQVIHECFSPAACYAGLLDYLRTVQSDAKGVSASGLRIIALAG